MPGPWGTAPGGLHTRNGVGGAVSKPGGASAGVCSGASPLSPQPLSPPLTLGAVSPVPCVPDGVEAGPPPGQAPRGEETTAGLDSVRSGRGCHGPSCTATNANPAQTRPLPPLSPAVGLPRGEKRQESPQDGEMANPEPRFLVPVADQYPLVWVPTR